MRDRDRKRLPFARNADEPIDDASKFELDALTDALLEGRLNGVRIAREHVQILMGLLERLGWTPDARELSGALPHFPDRFGIDEIRVTLHRLGFPSKVRDISRHKVTARRGASIFVDPQGHIGFADEIEEHSAATTQRGQNDEKSPLRFVAKGRYRLVEFQRKKPGSEQPPERGFSWTREIFDRFGGEVRLILLCTILSAGLTVFTAFGITMIFDAVVPTRNTDTLIFFLLGFALIFGVDFSFRRIRGHSLGHVAARIEQVLGNEQLSKLLALRPSMIASAPLGAQISRIRQFESLRDLPSSPLAQLVVELPVSIFLLVVITIIAWQLSLAIFLVGLLSLLLGISLAAALRKEAKLLGAKHVLLFKKLSETLSNRRHITRFGLWRAVGTDLATVIRDLAGQRRTLGRYNRALAAVAHCCVPLSSACVIGLGAVLVMENALSAGELIASSILTWRSIAPVQHALLNISQANDLRETFAQIDALMRLPEDPTSDEAEIHRMEKGEITLSDVSFRQSKSSKPTILGARLDLKHGTLATLTGPAGSGKSTLLKILAGLIEPQSGAVHLNGLNLTQLSQKFRSENIGYVPQKPHFFYGTVAQHLRFSDPTASEARLEELLSELGLGTWLSGLANGLHTKLDPSRDEAQLTASVRSALAVAAALLRDPAVLLVDETAGGMDRNLEEHLLSALRNRRGRMTQVLVTHRPSIIQSSDVNLILRDGRLQAQEALAARREALK